MGRGHDLNAVRRNLPAGQRIMHAVMVHGQAVAHGNGRKLKRHAPGQAYPVLDRFGQGMQMNVAGHNFIGRIDNAHQGQVHLFPGQTQGIQQRTVRGLVQPAGHTLASHNLTFNLVFLPSVARGLRALWTPRQGMIPWTPIGGTGYFFLNKPGWRAAAQRERAKTTLFAKRPLSVRQDGGPKGIR